MTRRRLLYVVHYRTAAGWHETAPFDRLDAAQRVSHALCGGDLRNVRIVPVRPEHLTPL